MDVSNIPPVVPGSSSGVNEQSSALRSNREKGSVQFSYTRTTTESVSFGYTKTGQANGVNNSENETQTFSFNQVKQTVWEQAYALLQQITAKINSDGDSEDGQNSIFNFNGDAQDPIGLGAYFDENPDDFALLQQGVVPDFFNVENTGQRILDIYFPNEDSPVNEETVNNARSLINQAYDEVGQLFGGQLPDLVINTQDYVNQRLDELLQV